MNPYYLIPRVSGTLLLVLSFVVPLYLSQFEPFVPLFFTGTSMNESVRVHTVRPPDVAQLRELEKHPPNTTRDYYRAPESITRCSLNQAYPSLSRMWKALRNLGFAPSIIRLNTSVLSLSH